MKDLLTILSVIVLFVVLIYGYGVVADEEFADDVHYRYVGYEVGLAPRITLECEDYGTYEVKFSKPSYIRVGWLGDTLTRERYFEFRNVCRLIPPRHSVEYSGYDSAVIRPAGPDRNWSISPISPGRSKLIVRETREETLLVDSVVVDVVQRGRRLTIEGDHVLPDGYFHD